MGNANEVLKLIDALRCYVGPKQLKLLVSAINPGTPERHRPILLKKSLRIILLELRDKAKEYHIERSTAYNAALEIEVFPLFEEDYEKGIYDNTLWMKKKCLLKRCEDYEAKLAVVGEVMLPLLELFSIVATDHDFIRWFDGDVTKFPMARVIYEFVYGCDNGNLNFYELMKVGCLERDNFEFFFWATRQAEIAGFLKCSKFKQAVEVIEGIINGTVKLEEPISISSISDISISDEVNQSGLTA